MSCKNWRSCLFGVLLGMLAIGQAGAQSIVGAWTIGSTTGEGTSVVVFLANGYYFQIQNAQASEAPHGFDGFERGTYTWNPATGAFTVTTLQDLNGDTGFSAINGVSGTITVSGDTLTFPEPDGGASVLTRVTGTSPIVGAWSFGNAALADNSGVVVFLPNGVYFMAEDGDSTAATGDPSGHDGIEHGTYAWNPATGALTSSRSPAPYVDTNGEWGLSHISASAKFNVAADGLTLTLTDGTDTFPLARVGAVSTPTATKPDLNQHGLTGSWYEPATGGQGFEVEVFANPSSGTGSTFVSWFTYDTGVGGAERQRWYTAEGQVVTGQPNASLMIYQNAGGNFNAPPVTNAQAVGTATLSFDTCSSGQLLYAFTDGTGRAGSIPLTRLTQNVTCSTTSAYPTNADFALSGNWFGGAATSGQGFTIEVNPSSGALFAAWYTYMPNGTAAGAAGQRWYTAQAAFTPGMRSMPVTIYETTGGVFDTPTPPGQKTVPVGTGTMAFQSCSAATFSYNFTGGSSSGQSGTINLSRVGPLPPGCTP
jgi:hypothetical protein